MQLFALQSRFFSIPNVNSVVTLIWYSIICNYSEIYIYGADFSGFKSINVNQKTNYVSVPVKHFYKNSKAEKDSSNKYQAKKNKSLGERLYQNYRVLKYNDLLKVNSSPDSEIILSVPNSFDASLTNLKFN